MGGNGTVNNVWTISSYQALCVHNIELLPGLFDRETLGDGQHGDVVSYTDTTGTCAVQDVALVLCLDLASCDKGCGANGGGQDSSGDATCALDIIVEHGVLVLGSVRIKELEGSVVAEVLELEYAVGPLSMNGLDRFVDEVIVGLVLLSRLWDAQVERVVPDLSDVATEVERDGQGVLRSKATTKGIEGQLTDSDLVTASTEVTETKDTSAIGAHNDMWLTRPRVKDSTNVSKGSAVQVQTTWQALPDFTVLLACCTYGWGVQEWDHLLQVLHSKGTEQGFVLLLQTSEIEPFLQGLLQKRNLFVASCNLLIQGLDTMWEPGKEVKLLAFFESEGSVLVQILVPQNRIHWGGD